MKTINIIGESSSMVRAEEGIYLEDLYWFLLQQKLDSDYYVINNSRRSNDFHRTFNNADDDIFGRYVHVIIFYLGIVDCFPRLFGRREELILSTLPRIGLGIITRIVVWLASKNRYFLTKHIKKVFVSPTQVESILHQLIQRIQREKTASHVYLLSVLDTNDATRARNYGVDDNIHMFNQIYHRVAAHYPEFVRYIDLNTQLTEDGFNPILADGKDRHISKEAHQRLAQILFREITQA